MILLNGLKLLKAYHTVSPSNGATPTADPLKLMDGNDAVIPYIYNSTTLTSKLYGWAFACIDTFKMGIFSSVTNGTRAYYGTSSSTASTESAPDFGVVYGDGNTPPNINDYNLSGNMFTDFTAMTSVSAGIDDSKVKILVTHNLTNTGATDFTIREFGSVMHGGLNANAGKVLLTRSLLETPVTILANGNGTVVLELEIG